MHRPPRRRRQTSYVRSVTRKRSGCFQKKKSGSAVAPELVSVTALFSGQGSQYVNMFKDVAENWPQFRTQVTTGGHGGRKDLW